MKTYLKLFSVMTPSRPGPWDKRFHVGLSRSADDERDPIGVRFSVLSFKRAIYFEPLMNRHVRQWMEKDTRRRLAELERKLSNPVELVAELDKIQRRNERLRCAPPQPVQLPSRYPNA